MLLVSSVCITSTSVGNEELSPFSLLPANGFKIGGSWLDASLQSVLNGDVCGAEVKTLSGKSSIPSDSLFVCRIADRSSE